jgi:glycosyltransferase involved in cell wall biosynthesis
MKAGQTQGVFEHRSLTDNPVERRISFLIVADPKIPIPPKRYGGTERIAYLVCRGLQERGHAVTLVASHGSIDFGGGLWVHKPASARILSRAFRKLVFYCVSLWISRNQQIIINFGRADYLNGLALFRRLPLIAWFQNPVTQNEINDILVRWRDRVRFVGVSKAQFEGVDPSGKLRVIHNAVDTEFFDFSPETSVPGYFVFLGRLTRNKGVHLAMDVARKANVPLKIAGNISEEIGGKEYFEREVKPRLDAQIEWIGPVDDIQKRSLLQGAKGLLFPIQWKEPFGIVLIESLACGTPVIALRVGATGEIVRDRETGFLCQSVDEMIEAAQRVMAGEIDRHACRADAEARFSQSVIISKTLAVVDQLLAPDGHNEH